jgi:hypothetical protein
MAERAETFLQNRVATPPEEERELFRTETPASAASQALARLPATVDGVGDDLVPGSILALTWAAREVSQRSRPDQLLLWLMDGQHSLWNDANACRDDIPEIQCVDILDIVHVAGYVWKAAKALCSTTKEQEEFTRDRLLRILRGEVAGVTSGLKRMATSHKLNSDKQADIHTVCSDFTAHQHRMKYDQSLAAGYPIATRVIEGACRHLFKDRLERSGMKWTSEGAQAMLTLRSIKASASWDEFQRYCHPLTNYAHEAPELRSHPSLKL